MKKINILGTEYKILFKTADEDISLKERDLSGYCDDTVKTIVIRQFEDDPLNKDDMIAFKNEVIRHEVIHAFLSESGLKENSGWATNETIIDYFAIQLPKLANVLFDYL